MLSSDVISCVYPKKNISTEKYYCLTFRKRFITEIDYMRETFTL